MGFFDRFKKEINTKKTVIRFNREPVCMADDVYNNIYDIALPDSATLSDLVDSVRYGGHGNDWPITLGYNWDIYTNIGRIAHISPQTERVSYHDQTKDIKLSSLGIRWVYAAIEAGTVDMNRLEDLFKD